MSTVLTNGIIIPENGSRNWGGDLANNWNIIDVNVGYMNDVKNKVTILENSVAENTANIQTNASNISALQTSKQDVIEDLETIRSGASSGATAVQPSTLSDYYTKAEVDTNLSSKANDGDVVHKSGDETIGGMKVFTGEIYSTTNSGEARIIAQNTAGGNIYLYANDSGRGLFTSGGEINLIIVSVDDSTKKVILRADSVYAGPSKIDCAVDSQGDGWIRFSGGLQICWGNFQGIATSQKTISFPKAFSNTPSIAVNGQGNILVTVDNWNNSSFAVVAQTSDSSPWFLWQAVGFWK